jgi:large subunit ribosomal protein L35
VCSIFSGAPIACPHFSRVKDGEIALKGERIVPKIRTRKSAAKRMEFTGSGKIKFRSNFNSHLLTRKSPKRKRRLQMPKLLDRGFYSAVKAMLPYGQL